MTTNTAILILGVVGACLLLIGGWVLLGPRRSDEEKERARRQFVGARGRICEAEVTEIEASVAGYSYQVSGVRYHVTQDLTAFRDALPRDPALLLGPVTIKYLPANPANSILMSEQWSGIRLAPLPKQKGA